MKHHYFQKILRFLILLTITVGQLFYFDFNPKARYLINLNLVREIKFTNITNDNYSEFVLVNKSDNVTKASENYSLTIDLIYAIDLSQKYLLHELELLALLHNSHTILLQLTELENSISRAPPLIF